MRKNQITLLFLSVVALCALFPGAKTFFELKKFLTCSSQVPIEKVELALEEDKGKNTIVMASFTYRVEESLYEASQPLRGYPNRFSAEKSLQTREPPTFVWVNSKRPSECLLRRLFPYKSLVSTAVVLALFGYFFLLIRRAKGRGA